MTLRVRNLPWWRVRDTIRKHWPNLMIEIWANIIGNDTMRALIDDICADGRNRSLFYGRLGTF